MDYVKGMNWDPYRGIWTTQPVEEPVWMKKRHYSAYVPPPKPWEGLDRNRFPATWNILVMFYYSGDWHSMTRWTQEDSYGGY